jgi:hypothetical protein
MKRMILDASVRPPPSEMIGVMIANAPLGNLWVLPDFFQFILGFPGAQDWVEAANHYLGDRMLYTSSYPVRSLKQSLVEFQRFSCKPGEKWKVKI